MTSPGLRRHSSEWTPLSSRSSAFTSRSNLRVMCWTRPCLIYGGQHCTASQLVKFSALAETAVLALSQIRSSRRSLSGPTSSSGNSRTEKRSKGNLPKNRSFRKFDENWVVFVRSAVLVRLTGPIGGFRTEVIQAKSCDRIV